MRPLVFIALALILFGLAAFLFFIRERDAAGTVLAAALGMYVLHDQTQHAERH